MKEAIGYFNISGISNNGVLRLMSNMAAEIAAKYGFSYKVSGVVLQMIKVQNEKKRAINIAGRSYASRMLDPFFCSCSIDLVNKEITFMVNPKKDSIYLGSTSNHGILGLVIELFILGKYEELDRRTYHSYRDFHIELEVDNSLPGVKHKIQPDCFPCLSPTMYDDHYSLYNGSRLPTNQENADGTEDVRVHERLNAAWESKDPYSILSSNASVINAYAFKNDVVQTELFNGHADTCFVQAKGMTDVLGTTLEQVQSLAEGEKKEIRGLTTTLTLMSCMVVGGIIMSKSLFAQTVDMPANTAINILGKIGNNLNDEVYCRRSRLIFDRSEHNKNKYSVLIFSTPSSDELAEESSLSHCLCYNIFKIPINSTHGVIKYGVYKEGLKLKVIKI